MSTKKWLKAEQEVLCTVATNFSSTLSTLGSTPNISKMSNSDKIPLFPKAKAMFIHSGNIINWNRLKRKPNQNSTDEVCECIGTTLGAYLESANKTDLQYLTELRKVNTENIQVLDENDRGEVKITVLNELGTNFVETLLLSVAPVSEDEDEPQDSGLSLKIIQPYWEVMEQLVAEDKVLSLGVCDLNKEAFEDLYNWAKVKPSIDQVNLESCCVMPKDLTEYAKSINVQLLTHNDRPVFIPKEKLKETILNVSTESDSESWAPQWVVRYSGILKCRGIISMKGYIFHAVRDKKR